MTLHNLIGGMAAKLLVALINLAILVLSSRYLGAASRGEISLFLLNIALVQLINEIYTGYSLIHFIPRFNSRRLIAGGIVASLLIVPCVNLAISAAGHQVPGQTYMALLTSFLVVVNTFCCIVLLGRGHLRYFYLLSILQPFLLIAGLFVSIFVFHSYTFEAYAIPLLFSFLFAAIVSSALVIRLPHLQGEFKLAPLLRKGLFYQVALILFLLANRFTYYVLPDTKQVGIYAAGTSIMDAALLLASGMAPALLSRLANDPEPRKSAMLTLALAKLSVVITLACVLMVLVVPAEVFVAVLGEGFTGLRTAMLTYSPGLLLASFLVPLAAFFTASGRQRTVLIGYSLGFITTVSLAKTFVTRWEIPGAAYTACISYLVIALFMTIVFIRANRLRFGDLLSVRPDFRLIAGLLRQKA